MTSPEPDDRAAALQQLVERGGRVRPLDDGSRAALLAQFRERTSERAPRPQRARAGLVLALGALSALAGVVILQRHDAPGAARAAQVAPAPLPSASSLDTAPASVPSPRRLSLGGRGEIMLEEGARVHVPPELERAGGRGPLALRLERGTLNASVAPRGRDEPLSIVTPHVAVVVVGTRFTVRVEGALTSVSVEHGRVRVDRGDRSAFVDGGQTLRSDDSRLLPPDAPRAARASPEPCASALRRTRCLRTVARGDGLAAENALFALALHARDVERDPDAALATLRTYARRFPQGVLREDAVLTAARILHERGRDGDACAYLRRHASAHVAPAWLPPGCALSRPLRAATP